MTVRVNVEFDLWASGRLGAFARAMGVNECEALGVLVFVWHETQHRELMLVTKELFASSISIRLGGYDAAMIFESMAKAGLLSHVDDQTWLIRGNDEHVSRLKKLRVIATAGGNASVQARAKLPVDRTVKRTLKRTVDRAVERTVELQLTCTEPSPNPPKLLSSLAPIQDPDLTTSDSNFTLPPQSEDLPRSPPSEKTARAESEEIKLFDWPAEEPKHTRGHRLRLAFEQGWERLHGRPYTLWNEKHGSNSSRITKSEPALQECFELLDAYWRTTDRRIIDSGYPFCDGAFSFVMQRTALMSQIARPDLRRAAQAVDAAQRLVSNEEGKKLTYEAEMRELRKGWDEPKRVGAMSSAGAVLRGAT